MTDLRLHLLGKPQVFLSETRIEKFTTAKTEALLYYLAVTAQAHSRDALATLLWGEMDESKAKRNLTKALSSLRKDFEPHLIIEPQNIAVDPNGSSQLDVAEFAAGLDAHEQNPDFEQLKQAVDRYQGDFLDEFFVRDALGFEDWMFAQREQLRQRLTTALEELVNYSLENKEIETGIQYAQRLLTLDPWRESAHQQMMRLYAADGQRSAAIAQYESLQDILQKELGVEPMAETTAMYDRMRGLGTLVTHNLRPASGVFVGRESERHQIISQLHDPACRLVSLVGPGGIGKTSLALQAARYFTAPERMLEEEAFRDGIYFIDLAPMQIDATNPGTTNERIASVLATAISEAMQFTFRSTKQPLDQILTHLQDKQILFIIDNFEDCISGAPYLSDMLRHAPKVKLLVTSRERLNLSEEWVLVIDGLPFPGELDDEHLSAMVNIVQTEDAQAASNSSPIPTSAVTLFIHQARRVKGDFTPNTEEMRHIVNICQMVEGSPLALQLAASWLRVLTSSEIKKEIRRSLDFLEASTRDMPERHRSIRAVFDPSWELLEEAERETLKRLSVFRGGFQRKAAKAVAQASLRVLANLVDKSWLRLSNEGRYRIHELVRQYAAEQLGQDTEALIETRDDHCKYYTHFLEQQIPRVLSHELPAALDDIGEEVSNIQASWGWALLSEYDDLMDTLSVFSRTMRIYYGRRGYFLQGMEMITATRERIEQSSPEEIGAAYPHYLGQLILWEGLFYHYLGEMEKCKPLFTRSLELLEQVDRDTDYLLRDLGGCYHLRGTVLRQTGDYAQSQEDFRKAQELDTATGNMGYAAKSAVFVGILDLEMGNFAKAESTMLEWLPRLQENNDFYYTGQALGRLICAQAILEKPLEDTIEMLRENVINALRIKSPWAEVHTLVGLGSALSLQGGDALTEAMEVLNESILKFQRIHAPMDSSLSYYWLGNTQVDLGQYDDAHESYLLSIKIAHEFGLLPRVMDNLVALADLHMKSSKDTDKDHLVELLATAQKHVATNARSQWVAQDLWQRAGLGELNNPPDLDILLEKLLG
ncbi:MAG: hypothetical protein DWQ07_15705 [Chloroflexi bacterium]|nr:MAG: hypothetical protein DWQ07_15705 [Chloroflexota bacterium]MBL1195196.1 hypothetical protein [Chloroflexota bacterium]NOH12481.1 hypothetical protein [Chloroflexota bacterium]